MRNDLVFQAVLFIESHILLLFALAHSYARTPCTREIAEDEVIAYEKTGKIPKFVEDFAIDLLSGRVQVDADNNLLRRRMLNGKTQKV